MEYPKLVVCTAIICCTLIVISPVACTMRQKELIADAVAKGADPIAAKCALGSNTDSRTDALCVLKAANK